VLICHWGGGQTGSPVPEPHLFGISTAVLILTLIQNPDGVAGAFYRRTHKRPALRPGRSDAAVHEPPAQRPAPEREPPAPRSPGPERAGESPVLSVRGLSVTFGGVRALDGVDLAVGEGELVGLIGPNGAGKTTFVDAITFGTGARHLRPSGGVRVRKGDRRRLAGARARRPGRDRRLPRWRGQIC
jgi:ABC-type glutathione transport system ATPase component